MKTPTLTGYNAMTQLLSSGGRLLHWVYVPPAHWGKATIVIL